MIMYNPILLLRAKLYWILAAVLAQIASCFIRYIMLGLILMPSELIMHNDYIATTHFRY